MTSADADLAARVEEGALRTRLRLRRAVFGGEIALVAALLVWWLVWGRHSHAHALLVLFLYCFPSEFLIAPVPHEPVLLYFARVVSPLSVALVSVAGTLLVEALNYHAFGVVAELRPLRRVVHARWLSRLVSLFERAPFAALVVGGLAPVPFYPFRFLVVVSGYPSARYLAAVFAARLPRFYLLALLGATWRLPDWVFVSLFVLIFAALTLPYLPWPGRDRSGAEPPQQASEPWSR